jgi:uncharacterized membrane protein
MPLTPGLRKLTLATHLACSVGWLGTVVAYLGLGVAAVRSEDTATVRAAWIAMELTGWFVIVPTALASLLTGVLLALGSKWGLFQHYWVVLSLLLTVVATAVLLLHMPDVSALAAEAQTADGARLEELGGDLAHPGIGLLVLLAVHGLNVYKPRGLTRNGQRRQHAQRVSSRSP